MRLANLLKKQPGLRFMLDAMELQSPVGKKFLLQQQMLLEQGEIEQELESVQFFQQLQQQRPALTEKLQQALSQVHDIAGTISLLNSGASLDDVSLFELKRFALLVQGIGELLDEVPQQLITLCGMQRVITILDPDGRDIPHFYVYDSYSEELKKLRQQLKQFSDDEQLISSLHSAIADEEDRIRDLLADELKPYADALAANLEAIARLDVWLAKGLLVKTYRLCRPVVHANKTSYRGLFHPMVAESLTLKGKRYQAIDIDVNKEPVLVTGVNMGGKTVLLKTLELCQYLFQFGFYVPAASAIIAPVEKILTSMDDEQSLSGGLSSYAAEMLRLNTIIHESRQFIKLLVLIDEPAKTTNPDEGEAIVNSLIDLLQHYHVRSLITTHYNGIRTTCRRLQTKGLRDEVYVSRPQSQRITEFMDYSLVELPSESSERSVPHEALRIAELLEIDQELLQGALMYLEQNNTENSWKKANSV